MAELLMAGKAAGASVLAAGMSLGMYNRANFMFDNSMRFERFCSARDFGIQQTGQYRKDLRKLTELTTRKMGLWCVSASLCMALCIALYCAGRLGLHGHSPPGWILGLWLVNNTASFCFMVLVIWLALHANFRSQVATVQLLTRKVRVPVPTLQQLDQARRLASEFEQQDWQDIFRIPYLNRPGVPKDTLPGDISPRLVGRGPATAGKNDHNSSWVRNEWELDRVGIITGPSSMGMTFPADTAPEHFQLYAAAQKEWWPYDVYARVSLLYGFLSFVHGLGYYGLGHLIVEVRCGWVAFACPFVIMVLHTLLLRFDIAQGHRKPKEYLPHCQWLGAVAVFFAAIAMTLEYRTEFNPTAIVCCYILQAFSYICQFVYQLRLLELVLPDEWHGMTPEETVGFTWFPDSWKVPSSFQHVLYLVAPPTKLAPGQNDLVRELRYGTNNVKMTPEEMETQARYLEDLFEWALSSAVMTQLSTPGQNAVQELQAKFEKARAAEPKSSKSKKGKKEKHGKSSASSEWQSVLQECYGSLDTLMTQEGITPMGLAKAHANPEAPLDPCSPCANEDPEHDEDVSSNLPKAVPHNGMRHAEPWRLVASIVGSMVIAWAIMMMGTFVEAILGEQAFVTGPHWSRPPMSRASLSPHEMGTPMGFPWPAGSRPFLPEQLAWHEEKEGMKKELLNEGQGYAGIPPPGAGESVQEGKRRLSDGAPLTRKQASRAVDHSLRGLLGTLPPQVAALAPKGSDASAVSTALAAAAAALGVPPVASTSAAPQMATQWQMPTAIDWPALFEPKLLACRQGFVAALSPRGYGATALLDSNGGTRGAKAATSAEAFRLVGLSDLPPLIGATWHGDEMGADKEGLLLVSAGGHLLTCPGPRPSVAGGPWKCGALGDGAPQSLPGFGARAAVRPPRPLVAAAAWLRGEAGAGGEPQLHAAVVDRRTPDVAALYLAEANGAWLPLGEIAVPAEASMSTGRSAISLAFDVSAGELLVGAHEGALVRRRLRDGAVVQASSSRAAGRGTEWQAACPSGDEVAHLILREHGGQESLSYWRPEVIALGYATQKDSKDLPLIFE